MKFFANTLIKRNSHTIGLYVSVSLFALGLPLAMFLNGSLFVRETRVSDKIGEIEDTEFGRDKKSINLWFQAVAFDAETQKARFNVYPWPSADLIVTSFASSTISDTDFSIWIDELSGQGTYDFKKNQAIGALTVDLDVLSRVREIRSSDSYYPFDMYALDAYADTSFVDADDSLTPAKTFDFFYTNSVPGFQIDFSRIAAYNKSFSPEMHDLSRILEQRDQGYISFIAEFRRSLAVKIAVSILSLIILLNSITLVLITGRVVKGIRPPSMQALVWSAASVLGTIQLRSLFPGNPRLGIALDFLVFFPGMLASMVVGVVLATSWIRRSDFQI